MVAKTKRLLNPFPIKTINCKFDVFLLKNMARAIIGKQVLLF